jgi:hypothetical protein
MNLESFALLGSGISGFAALIGLSVAIIQLGGVNASLKHSNLTSIFQFETEMNRRKEQMASIRLKLSEFLKDRPDETLSDSDKKYVEALNEAVKEANENYLNAFERISYFIVNKLLKEEDFRVEYREMLFDTIKEDNYDMFDIKTPYRNMMKLYNKWKDK